MEIHRWQEVRGAGFPQHRLGSLMRNMARGMREAHPFAVFVIFSTAFFICADGQEPFNDFNGYNLNPPYFNLAEGSRISATATCGEDESGRPRYDLYCKLVGGPTIGVPTENIQVRKNCISDWRLWSDFVRNVHCLSIFRSRSRFARPNNVFKCYCKRFYEISYVENSFFFQSF